MPEGKLSTSNSEFEVKRLLAVGDIHGCLDKLKLLLDLVVPQGGDQFVFLGDYIDRGPDNVGVIDYLLEFGQNHPAVFLRGNHEQMMLDFLTQKDRMWLAFNNGGEVTLYQYKASRYVGVPTHHMEFFQNLPFGWTWGNYIFVHAGLRPNVPFNQQSAQDVLWIRGPFIGSRHDWGKTVVFGHTPMPEPLLTSNKIGIDTGAVRGGQLTCCDVLTRTVWSV